MAPLQTVCLLLLCVLASGQDEEKSAADFARPFKVFGDLIVDKNLFLLRELTAEEQKTGVVDLEDPFNEKGRSAATTTTTTPAPARAGPGRVARGPVALDLDLGLGIPRLLPPAPVSRATRRPAVSQRPAGRFPPRTSETPRVTTEAPAVTTEAAEVTQAPVRVVQRVPVRKRVRVKSRGGAGRDQRPTVPSTTAAPQAQELPTVSSFPQRGFNRFAARVPTTRAPTTEAATEAETEAVPTTTAAPEPAETGAPVVRGRGGRRQQVVNRRIVQSPAAPAVRKISRTRVVPAPAPEPVQPQLPPTALPPPAIPKIPAISNRRPVSTDSEERLNEVETLSRRLPSGSQTVVKDMASSSFSCKGRPYGYFADMAADCQVFHICTPVTHADGYQQNIKHSFFCNNGTLFDQRTLSCREEDLALPCDLSEKYYTSTKFFEKFNIFDRMREEDERRRRRLEGRLETLEDVEALEQELE